MSWLDKVNEAVCYVCRTYDLFCKDFAISNGLHEVAKKEFKRKNKPLGDIVS